jgi:hypothetical protein
MINKIKSIFKKNNNLRYKKKVKYDLFKNLGIVQNVTQ